MCLVSVKIRLLDVQINHELAYTIYSAICVFCFLFEHILYMKMKLPFYHYNLCNSYNMQCTFNKNPGKIFNPFPSYVKTNEFLC